jgi:hypothetical protein
VSILFTWPVELPPNENAGVAADLVPNPNAGGFSSLLTGVSLDFGAPSPKLGTGAEDWPKLKPLDTVAGVVVAGFELLLPKTIPDKIEFAATFVVSATITDEGIE